MISTSENLPARGILVGMVAFAQTTQALKSRNETAQSVALFYAGLLVVMAVGQLFSFEKFIPLLESFGLPGGHGTATAIAGMIVVSEVFVLPFLLRMWVSPLLRVVSMILGWIVPLLWILLTVWLNVTATMAESVGIFGTKVALPVGWWAVCYAVALGILSGWASWGMWPVADRGR